MSGLSQKEVAQRMGITASALSKIEHSHRGLKIEDFVAYAEAIGKKPGDLLPNSSAAPLDPTVSEAVELLAVAPPDLRAELVESLRRTSRLWERARLAAQRDVAPSVGQTASPERVPSPVSAITNDAISESVNSLPDATRPVPRTGQQRSVNGASVVEDALLQGPVLHDEGTRDADAGRRGHADGENNENSKPKGKR